MPRIYDKIELQFLPALETMLHTSRRADFCVGYFTLRGWQRLGEVAEPRFSGGDESQCRVLVGMQTVPDQDLRRAYSLIQSDGLDQAPAVRLKRQMAD